MTFEWNLVVFLTNALETSVGCDKMHNDLLTGTKLKLHLLQCWSEACDHAGAGGSLPTQRGHGIDTCISICLWHLVWKPGKLKVGEGVTLPPGDKCSSITLEENPQPFSPWQTCSYPGWPAWGSVPITIRAGRENNPSSITAPHSHQCYFISTVSKQILITDI